MTPFIGSPDGGAFWVVVSRGGREEQRTYLPARGIKETKKADSTLHCMKASDF